MRLCQWAIAPATSRCLSWLAKHLPFAVPQFLHSIYSFVADQPLQSYLSGEALSIRGAQCRQRLYGGESILRRSVVASIA